MLRCNIFGEVMGVEREHVQVGDDDAPAKSPVSVLSAWVCVGSSAGTLA